MKKKIRPLGKILLDAELLINEAIDSHDIQLGDLLALVKSHCEIHRQDCIEEYTDGTKPVFYYGHKDFK